jgi:hypothetical protein
MLTSTKQVSIAIAVTLALGMPLSPAFSASAPSNTAIQNQAAPALRSGNLVRLRSGGAIDDRRPYRRRSGELRLD